MLFSLDSKNLSNLINHASFESVIVIMLAGTGLYLSFVTRFIQLRKFKVMIKTTLGSLTTNKKRNKCPGTLTPFQAVSTALAGTIGTGSIAGVAAAIISGGPGSVFWMWVSAFLGMVIKYSEIILSVKFREEINGQRIGGPMYYIKNGINCNWLAIIFSLATMAACLGIGNAVQSNSIADALYNSKMEIKKELTATLLVIVVAIVILGGIKRIASVNEKFVPIMALSYVVCGIVAICVNSDRIPAVFSMIFKDAFNLKAAAGGGGGYAMICAIKSGFSKGVFSNEAGLGSAPIAHAASNAKNGCEQGFWGMFEVFFTTIIICTISALVILTAGIWELSDIKGSTLCIASFNEAIPGAGEAVVTLSTVLFALSTILGWAYYGETALHFLVGESKILIQAYRFLYVATVYVGAISNLDTVWNFSEFMNGLMTIPNLVAIVSLSKLIKKDSLNDEKTIRKYIKKHRNYS